MNFSLLKIVWQVYWLRYKDEKSSSSKCLRSNNLCLILLKTYATRSEGSKNKHKSNKKELTKNTGEYKSKLKGFTKTSRCLPKLEGTWQI